MKKLVYFGASSSSTSINHKLAAYAASKVTGVEHCGILISDYEMPIYSSDYEEKNGIPEMAQKFLDHIKSADACIMSFAEHNGSYAAAFKNVLDWVSRIDYKAWKDLPTVILATSPGARGGATVHQTAMTSFPRFGADLVGGMCVPSFTKSFVDEKLIDETLEAELSTIIKNLQAKLS